MKSTNIIIVIFALALLGGCNAQGGANMAGPSSVTIATGAPAAGTHAAASQPATTGEIHTDMNKNQLSGLVAANMDEMKVSLSKLLDVKMGSLVDSLVKANLDFQNKMEANITSKMDAKLSAKLTGLDNSKSSFDKAAADMVKDHAAQAKGNNNRVFSFDGSAWPLLVFMIVVAVLMFVMVVIWWFFHKTKRHAENLTYGLTQLMQATEDENSDAVKANFSKRIQHSGVAPIVDRLLTNTIIRKKD